MLTQPKETFIIFNNINELTQKDGRKKKTA